MERCVNECVKKNVISWEEYYDVLLCESLVFFNYFVFNDFLSIQPRHFTYVLFSVTSNSVVKSARRKWHLQRIS